MMAPNWLTLAKDAWLTRVNNLLIAATVFHSRVMLLIRWDLLDL